MGNLGQGFSGDVLSLEMLFRGVLPEVVLKDPALFSHDLKVPVFSRGLVIQPTSDSALQTNHGTVSESRPNL